VDEVSHCRCAGTTLARWLRDGGHDVREAQGSGPDPGDEELLVEALAEGRVLVTLDKEFGALASPIPARLLAATAADRRGDAIVSRADSDLIASLSGQRQLPLNGPVAEN
jgi:hypothetical protein